MMYLILSKKTAVIILILVLFGSSFAIIRSYAGTFFKRDCITVIVDAGHGLPDGGAVGTGGTVE